MPDLLFFILLGHFLGDFALQSDSMANEKGNSHAMLTLHVSIYVVVVISTLLCGLIFLHKQSSFSAITTLIVAVALFAQHWLQDKIKATCFNGAKQAFYVDQGIHLIVLYVIRLFIYNY